MSEDTHVDDATLYRELFEQSPDGIVLVDAETGDMLRFNRQVHEALGYTADEFARLKIQDIDIDENETDVQHHMQQITAVGEEMFQARHRRKSGDVMDVLVVSRALEVGGRAMLQSVWRDVSAEKRLRDRLRRERAEAVEFALDLAHDLSAPLRVLRKHCNAVSDGTRRDEMLGTVNDALRQMETMLDDLRHYARTGSNDVAMESVCLRDVFDQAAAILSEFQVLTNSDLDVNVIGNHTQLVRVFYNLFDNSAKYGASHAIMFVELRGDRWQVSVCDDGPGVPRKHWEEVFRPLRRLTTWWEVPGTGLGLAACRRIVELHGGVIGFEDPYPFGGAVVTFDLEAA